MATQLFLRHPSATPPYTIQRSDLAVASRSAEPATASRKLSGTSNTSGAATVTGPTAGVPISFASLQLEWISPPFAADTTIAGTMTFNVWAFESAMTANVGMQVIVDVIDVFGNLKGTTIINSEHGIELGTASAAMNWTGTPTSTLVGKGERVRIRVLGNDAGGTMAAAASFTVDLDTSTAAATGDTWIQFNETFSFAADVASGTILKCTATAAGISPGGAVAKIMEAAGPTGTSDAVTNTAAGFTSPIQTTETAGGTPIEWYTRPLEAVSFDQVHMQVSNAIESSALAKVALKAELARTAGDGSGATVICAGVYAVEVGTGGGTGLVLHLTFPTVSLTAGQRLRFRIYIDDHFTGPMASGFTVTVTDYDQASGQSFVRPNATIVEQSAAGQVPYVNPMPQLLAQ